MERIIIFDTTLRDGEQTAGVTLTPEEKLEIAKQLDKLGVDVIEVGFPWSSPGEIEAFKLITAEVKRPIICALSYARLEAVDKAWEALKGAEKPRIHVFLSSSDIHLYYQLRKSRDEILTMVGEMVSRAKNYVEDVEFSPMDATRTDPKFLYQVIKVACEAGATVINIPDTVGYTTPFEFRQIISGILQNVPEVHKVILSVHCHNDLGLAVANSLAVLDLGVRQIEGTINGIGERAGNAALEEIIMAIKTRQDLFPYSVNIDTTQIYKTSRLVSKLTGIPIQPNKAIVGANAFRHSSGIHQDGVLKERITYEIIDPKSVGIPGSVLVMGKLSGRHALKKRLEEMGYFLSEEELKRIFIAFKELADRKKEVTDKDIETLISYLKPVPEAYKIEHIQITCGEPGIPSAIVRLRSSKGELLTGMATGNGPVDAACKAISEIVKIPCKLVEFSVSAVTEGLDAVGEVTIKIESDGRRFVGRGASTDIIVASAKAYINALNKVIYAKKS